MNGFADRGLDEGAFGEKQSGGIRSFDAFRKANTIPVPTYTMLSDIVDCMIAAIFSIDRFSRLLIKNLTIPCSKNQSHVHPSHNRRRICDNCPHHHIRNPNLFRDPKMVRRSRDTSLLG